MILENPANGYRVTVGEVGPFLGCLFFGGIYFLAKGVWRHFWMFWIIAVCTLCVSWLIYPFFAAKVVRNSYLEKGWRVVK